MALSPVLAEQSTYPERGIVVAPGAYLGAAGEGYVRVALVPTVEDCERAAAILGAME